MQEWIDRLQEDKGKSEGLDKNIPKMTACLHATLCFVFNFLKEQEGKNAARCFCNLKQGHEGLGKKALLPELLQAGGITLGHS